MYRHFPVNLAVGLLLALVGLLVATLALLILAARSSGRAKGSDGPEGTGSGSDATTVAAAAGALAAPDAGAAWDESSGGTRASAAQRATSAVRMLCACSAKKSADGAEASEFSAFIGDGPAEARREALAAKRPTLVLICGGRTKDADDAGKRGG